MNEKKYIVKRHRLLAGERGGPKDVMSGDEIMLPEEQAAILLASGSIAPAVVLTGEVDEQVDAGKISDIVEAIGQLDEEDDSLWTGDGRPQLNALSEALGRKVSGKERNMAWVEYQDLHGDSTGSDDE